jgi:hypothetical protein
MNELKQKPIYYTDANGEHSTAIQTKPVKTGTTILNYTTAETNSEDNLIPVNNPLPTMPVNTLTDAQRQEIAEANEATERMPLIKLETVFYQNEVMYEILERTDQFALLRATELLRNPDGSLPRGISIKNRKKGVTYWTIAKIFITQPDELDYNGFATGRKLQKQEICHINLSIELTVTDSKGIPTDKLGFNADFDRVRSAYQQSIQKYNDDQHNLELKAMDKLRREKQQAKASKFNKEIMLLRSEISSEILALVQDIERVSDVLQNKRLLELAERILVLQILQDAL